MGSARIVATAFAVLFVASRLSAADATPRRVLIVTSFGSRFAPFETYATELRTELVDGWPAPIEFLETPLEIARFPAPPEEGPLADYLRTLVANRKLDLVVTIGAPAADFVSRRQPFPGVPTLIAGLERRQAADLHRQGSEIGDKCAWLFTGPVTLSNGSVWQLQEEWSNAVTGCVQGQ